MVIARDRHKLDGRPRHSEALAVRGPLCGAAREYDTVAYDHRLLSLTPVPNPALRFVLQPDNIPDSQTNLHELTIKRSH